MNNQNTIIMQQPEPLYLEIAPLVEYLQRVFGYSISRTSIYRHVRSGSIPHIHGPGKRLLFPVAKVRLWIENGGQVPAATNNNPIPETVA